VSSGQPSYTESLKLKSLVHNVECSVLTTWEWDPEVCNSVTFHFVQSHTYVVYLKTFSAIKTIFIHSLIHRRL
jgi:hypothetical protein